MAIRCSLPTCSNIVNFKVQFKQIGEKVFCSNMCSDDWIRQNELFKFAAAGGPVLSRRPTRPKHWYEKDG